MTIRLMLHMNIIDIFFYQTGMTDGDYLAIIHQILLPVAHQFDPQLVLISAGYDAATGDPEVCVIS